MLNKTKIFGTKPNIVGLRIFSTWMNYAAGNKLPVMTFQGNSRVGIRTRPPYGSCA
jgi:hypothetical protein